VPDKPNELCASKRWATARCLIHTRCSRKRKGVVYR
jgi:hypothetical protein